MIVTQFLRAFPGAVASINYIDSDAWHAFHTPHALHGGMRKWFNEHNLMCEPSATGGYDVRWISQPYQEHKVFKTVLHHAQMALDDISSGLEDGTYEAKDNPDIQRDLERVKDFEAAAKEAGLL